MRATRPSIHLPIRIGAWVLLAGLLAAPSPAHAMLNPAAVYCRALGYGYFTTKTPKGTVGLCKLPDGRLVQAWKFYRGEVGLEASYCAKQGYQARRLVNDPVCKSCTACVLPGGELKPVAEIMKLSFDESVCGDGACGTMEHRGKCPADCASGLHDEHCDGEADGICDRDCQEQSLPDPDCAPPTSGGEGGGSGCGCGVEGHADDAGGAGLLLPLLLGAIAAGRRRRFGRTDGVAL